MTPEQRSAAIGDADWTDDRSLRELIEHHIREAVAEEREACARICEEMGDNHDEKREYDKSSALYMAHAKILARGASGQTGPVSG